MKIITPEEITDTTLDTSNVPLTDYTEWTAGTYAEGATVREGEEAYESLTASNTDQPSVGILANPPTWLRLGYVNRWRMFRDGTDSITSQADSIAVTVIPVGLITAVALLGCRGATAQVIMTDTIEGVVYDQTKELIDYGVDDWWSFYFVPYDSNGDVIFRGLPPYIGAEIDVIIDGNDPADIIECGRAVFGVEHDLGVTEYGTNVSRLDASTKERDGFGNLRLVRRRTVPVVDYRIAVETIRFDWVERRLARIAAVPCVFIGSTLYESTIVFGIYTDFRMDLSTPVICDATIEVEGL